MINFIDLKKEKLILNLNDKKVLIITKDLKGITHGVPADVIITTKELYEKYKYVFYGVLSFNIKTIEKYIIFI